MACQRPDEHGEHTRPRSGQGVPAVRMVVRLSVWTEDGWHTVAESVTDANGRVTSFPGSAPVAIARLRDGESGNSFYPYVPVPFVIDEPQGTITSAVAQPYG